MYILFEFIAEEIKRVILNNKSRLNTTFHLFISKSVYLMTKCLCVYVNEQLFVFIIYVVKSRIEEIISHKMTETQFFLRS